MLDELLMNGVRDQRDGFACETQFKAEFGSEGFGGQRGEQVPFNMVEEVVVSYLNVNLLANMLNKAK